MKHSLLLMSGLLALAALLPAVDQPALVNQSAPELKGDGWINTPDGQPLTLAGRKGQVTVVHFWTFGCINCRHNLPVYARWYEKYASKGVEIIGIHSPEFPNERVPENVRKESAKLGVKCPVLLDPDMQNWGRWHQRYWPAVYLIDKQGRIRARWEGELNYGGALGENRMGLLIEQLLAE